MITLTDLEIGQRLLLAVALGGMLGAEREMRQKSAGFRTNILIAMGSAIFTILSLELASTPTTDQTRIAAQIVVGVGFLGAGAIMRTRGGVQGLTTAATVWVNAALGTCAGAGQYHLALIGGAITLVVLLILSPIEAALDRRLLKQPKRSSTAS